MKNGVIQAVAAAAMVTGAASAQAEAVQWRVEDGGNGHWYDIIIDGNGLTKSAAISIARDRGAHLGTITSSLESNFVKQLSDRDDAWANFYVGPILGMSCNASDCLTGCWDTGEAVEYTEWHPGNPDSPMQDNCVMLYIRTSGAWQNYPCDSTNLWGTRTISAIVEWSADCNSDGIVDFGQIRAGELDDANANNIPDCCEQATPCACPGDLNGDGVVNGADIGAILAFWGPNPVFAAADITRDGQVNGADLGALLSTWGPCGQ